MDTLGEKDRRLVGELRGLLMEERRETLQRLARLERVLELERSREPRRTRRQPEPKQGGDNAQGIR